MTERNPEAFDSRFIEESGELWERAIHSPFLDWVSDGTLLKEAFDRWLAQDYHFVSAFFRFVAALLSRSERAAQPLLVQGVSVLDGELAWFEGHARARGLELGGPPHPVCQRYNHFMLRAAHEESPRGLYALLYGVEVSYCAAWSAIEPRGPYREFIERWSSPGFSEYVAELKHLCERRTDASSQRLFSEVLRHEEAFWTMSMSG